MGPRLFGIPATASPVIAVLRRGPSGWTQVLRWDPEAGLVEPGAWLHGVLYPQRCDVSPDGRWLAYFALKGGTKADWAPRDTYIAVSRLPWLTALAGWGTGGTWTRGVRFVERGAARHPLAPPDVGEIEPLRKRFDLEVRRPAAFAVERERGWSETADTPPRRDGDLWDERRIDSLTMAKPRPGDPATRLLARGWHAAFRDGEPRRGPARYAIAVTEGPERPLPGVAWAEWGRDGRLLAATVAGELQIWDAPGAGEPSWRFDTSVLAPAPAPAPEEARHW